MLSSTKLTFTVTLQTEQFPNIYLFMGCLKRAEIGSQQILIHCFSQSQFLSLTLTSYIMEVAKFIPPLFITFLSNSRPELSGGGIQFNLDLR